MNEKALTTTTTSCRVLLKPLTPQKVARAYVLLGLFFLMAIASGSSAHERNEDIPTAKQIAQYKPNSEDSDEVLLMKLKGVSDLAMKSDSLLEEAEDYEKELTEIKPTLASVQPKTSAIEKYASQLKEQLPILHTALSGSNVVSEAEKPTWVVREALIKLPEALSSPFVFRARRYLR